MIVVELDPLFRFFSDSLNKVRPHKHKGVGQVPMSKLKFHTIKAREVNKFRDPEQARIYATAQAVKKNLDDIARYMVSLDNGPLDLNQEAGVVVLAGANVDEELGSKKHSQFGLNYVDATVKFDPKTRLATKLDVTAPDYQISAKMERGFLGLGQQRCHVSQLLPATPAEAGALERRPSQSYFFNDGKVKHKLQEYVVYM